MFAYPKPWAMKVLLVTITGLVFLAAFSCTKTNNVYEKKPLNPIVGLWVGAYKWVGSNPSDSFYYSIDVQPNGTAVSTAIAGGSSAAGAGPWNLNGTNFTATLTELAPTTSTPKIVTTVTGTYDSVAGTLVGGATYSAVNPSSTFVLRRVQ